MRQDPHRRHPFLAKLRKGVKASHIDLAQPVIVSVSGGFDSTALLLGLHEISRPDGIIFAAHFNHRLRGKESDDDEKFVESTCKALGIRLNVARAEIRADSSSEDEARTQRYEFLAYVAQQLGAQSVALAHTIEDQAETVLLRLTRGAGIRGMGGMRRRMQMDAGRHEPITIARPMIDITHAEARSFLDAVGINARHDASNDDWERFARNRIRHRVISELQQINPGVIASIVRFSRIMQSQSDLLDSLIDETIEDSDIDDLQSFNRARLIDIHPSIAAELLTRMYKRNAAPKNQLTDSHIRMMLKIAATGNGSYDLPGGAKFEARNNVVRITGDLATSIDNAPGPLAPQESELLIPGTISLMNGFELVASIEPAPDRIPKDRAFDAWLSPKLILEGKLTVRSQRPGDLFQPLGMAKDVRLRRFLVNTKLPKQCRDGAAIVASHTTEKIIWVAGVRPAEWAKLLPEHEECLHLSLRQKCPVPSADASNHISDYHPDVRLRSR